MVWQFTADDSTVLEAEFGELAAQLGVRDIADTRDPVASVHGRLATFPAEWLLIFDNVPDRASIERFLPPAGSGRILITSQNPSWPHGQALEVQLLGPEVAADFVITRTGDQDRQAAQELVGVMDRLPLALEQAAAYILATGGTLAEYLGLFRQRRTEMLRRGEPTGYPGTVDDYLGIGVQPTGGVVICGGWAAAASRFLRSGRDPLAPAAATSAGAGRGTASRGDRVADAVARGSTGRQGRHCGATPVLTDKSSCRRFGVGPPPGASRHGRPDVHRASRGMATSNRYGDRCCDPRGYSAAR